MKPIMLFGVCLLTLGLVGALSVEAQPQRGMMGGARLEQILVFLAFDEDVNVSDAQFLKLREVLKGVYVKQQEMMQEMMQMRQEGGGDFEEFRERMAATSEEMNQRIAAVLDAEQIKKRDKYIESMQSRRESFRGRRGRF